MKPNCIAEVQAAAQKMGRDKPVSKAELEAIDARLRKTMRRLARTDPEWQSKPAAQRTMEAAQQAMADIKAEAARKVQNAQRQALAAAATEQRVTTAHGDTRSAKLVDDIDHTGHYVQGIKMESMGNLMALVDAVRSYTGAGAGRRIAMFLFDVKNPAMSIDLAREIFRGADGSTGNKIAREGAKAWLSTIEGMRQRFNAGGGDVGKLDYGYLPQPHDAARVRGAGRDKWIGDILPALDRSRFVDEAGARLDDAAMRDLLGNVFETIATEGLNKQEPGQFKGAGARANHGSETRELHFTEDGYLGYLNRYGTGSMYDAMVGHVGRMARDIGLVERYGPNPNAQIRLQLDHASHADGRPVADLPRSFGLPPQLYWENISGATSAPRSARLAQIGTDVRNVQTFGKLGAAVISSITDLATYFRTVRFNKLNYWQSIGNIKRTATSSEQRAFLTSHGVIAESMAGDLTRWTNDNIKATWSGRLANSVLRLSLLNAWTDTLRRAFSLTMMQGMARMAGHDWGALSEWDRALMERKGLTAEDWSVIRQAQLTPFQGLDHLTPESIRATGHERVNEIVAKVLGLIQDESEFAVVNPDLATKVIASGGLQRGTMKGELWRSALQFKSFPIAMVSRHWRRMIDMPQVADGSAPMLANRAVYIGGLMVSTTVLGGIALQAKQVLSGKDPIDMAGSHAAKFWAKAVAQGGGLSIMGDMLLNDPGSSTADYAKNTVGALAGPAVSDITKLAAIPTEAVWQKAKGKPTKAGADVLNVARSTAPYINLWYMRAAIDHAGMQALQENVSPGYLGRMRQAAQRDWGQQYWWTPGTGGPQRAPDFAGAVGQ